MVRFPALEAAGAGLALMTDASDGDCGFRGGPESRGKLCERMGVVPGDLVCAQQMHGTHVAVAKEADRGRGVRTDRPAFPVTDAIVTDVPGLPLAIFIADCVPVFIVDPCTQCIALIHAGREGTLHGISGRAVEVLRETYGALPDTMRAFVGPSAGPCCYEVDVSRAEEFASAGWRVHGRHLDLWNANVCQLAQSGIPESHITVANICTICREGYHSHRRNPNGQRNMSLLMI